MLRGIRKQPGEQANIHVYAWSNYYDFDALGNSSYGSVVTFLGSREMFFLTLLVRRKRSGCGSGCHVLESVVGLQCVLSHAFDRCHISMIRLVWPDRLSCHTGHWLS